MLTVRRGSSLAELLVAMTVGGMVLAAAVSIGVSQQRLHRAVRGSLGAEERLRHAASVLPVGLRAATPALDFVPGGLQDTVLDYMETVAAGVACAISAATVTLPAATPSGPTLAGAIARPEPGDTLWLLDADSSLGEWKAQAIVDVRGGSACTSGFAPHAADITLVLASPPSAGSGAAYRVTRRARYSIYRSDGGWHLGYSTWSAVLGAFGGVQPASGPYERPGVDRRGVRTGFAYFDASGAELLGAGRVPTGVARVELRLRTPAEGGASTREIRVTASPRNLP